MNLLAYANQGFHLVLSSGNAGVMKPVSGGQGQVPYTINVFNTSPVSFAQKQSISLWPQATSSSGVTIPVSVTIPVGANIKGQP